MAVSIPIATYITIGEITTYLQANYRQGQSLLRGGDLVPKYPSLLRIVCESVAWKYDQNPNDETLNATGLYLLALIGRWYNEAAAIANQGACVPVVITGNPSSQTINEGDNVTFSVTVFGTSPIAYQWQKNGSPIVGATNSTYQITGAVTGDAGSYRCIVTNACGTATSTAATLTVNATSITVSYWYGDVDNYADIVSGIDGLTYNGSFSITHNATIAVPFPLPAAVNKYLVIRVPRTESDKTTWYNTALNNGTFPDISYREVVKPVGLPIYTYYISRVAVSNDFPTNTLQLSA